ncbi:hypothetical protein GmHk_03G008955 [Glycine max]|nr:hypothetical protein GmHk_03G008955 [Glycine max]
MAAYTTTPDHNIQLTAQDIAQALRTDEHFRRVIGSDRCFPNMCSSTCPPMPAPDRRSASSYDVS